MVPSPHSEHPHPTPGPSEKPSAAAATTATTISTSTPDQHKTHPHQPQPAATDGANDKGKGKAKSPNQNELLPVPSSAPESLLKRLAGPSTGKAGLKRDPEEVQRIIYEASKGSKFFLNEQAKDAKMTADLLILDKKMQRRLTENGHSLAVQEADADRLSAKLEATRVLDQVIVCIDCDAFYASVEELHDPSLKGTAFAVGSGVLTTASYEARKWGCRSAMAGYIARKLCPHLKFVKLDFAKYGAASESVMKVLSYYDPNLCPASMDEAFMNITEYCKEHELSPAEATERMRKNVLDQTGLTVSAGVGPNTMIAKIAADINKPNGQFVCAPTRAASMEFMANLPVRKVPGVGRITERWLVDGIGIKTVQDIWTHRGKLALMRSDIGLESLMHAYLGLGRTVVEPGKREDRRSVGCEKTFHTLYRSVDLIAKLRELADDLAADLKRLEFSGRTVTLKYKLDTYQPFTRSVSMPGKTIFISSADDLFKYGKVLLEKEIEVRKTKFDARSKTGVNEGLANRDLRLRLLGLRMTGLRDERPEAVSGRKNTTLDNWTNSGDALTNAGTSPSKHRDPGSPGFASASKSTSVECPVCGSKFPEDPESFNNHLDICLFQAAEREDIPASPAPSRSKDGKRAATLQEELGQPSKKKKKKKQQAALPEERNQGKEVKTSITDYFKR